MNDFLGIEEACYVAKEATERIIQNFTKAYDFKADILKPPTCGNSHI
jgi:hypothetical protein